MRLVLDTNVLVSAFLWECTPGRLIELAGEKVLQMFTSRALLDELASTLAKKKIGETRGGHGLDPPGDGGELPSHTGPTDGGVASSLVSVAGVTCRRRRIASEIFRRTEQ